jgi:SSS family solute:Na+ symporter
MDISKEISLIIIAVYFAILLLVSYFTNRNSTKQSFFTGDKNSPWFLVAFGMIGASLSGITFISVPGTVHQDGLTYLTLVFGFLLGYIFIAFVLLPIYYKLNLTSIYTYLNSRFGKKSYLTGAIFFLLSKVVGASLRLYLVAEVLDIFLFQPYGIPYILGILFTIFLIWVYTFKGGIKTIVWTDTIQTASMLLAVGISIYFIKNQLNLSFGELLTTLQDSPYTHIIDWKNKSWGSFFLSLLNGALIAIVMTGLDQDMMQKNLTCKNLKDAQKNIISYSIILIPVNFLFLILGILIYTFAIQQNFLSIEEVNDKVYYCMQASNHLSESDITPDKLFPTLAGKGYFPPILGVVFLIGLIAAAYSSADSALTSLTTCFCVDILDNTNPKTRIWVHIGMSLVLVLMIIVFKQINSSSVIKEVFNWAGLTYGPLLGLFSFGIFTRLNIKDNLTPYIAIFSVVSSFLLHKFSKLLFNDYQIGFEILLINALITFLLLFFSEKKLSS